MLMCDKTATLIHCIRSGDSDTYECLTICGVSWFAKTVIKQGEGALGSNSGAKPRCIYKVRIPSELVGVMPCCGDYMALGDISSIKSTRDLSDYDYFHITAVSDNRRGAMPHVAVSGV